MILKLAHAHRLHLRNQEWPLFASKVSYPIFTTALLTAFSISMALALASVRVSASLLTRQTCSRACLRLMIEMSHDSSHPIGSIQIPLEHTNTVQEFPDLPFCVLVMQYTQGCRNRRVWTQDWERSHQVSGFTRGSKVSSLVECVRHSAT